MVYGMTINTVGYEMPAELANMINPRPFFYQKVELWKYYLDSYIGGKTYQEGNYLYQMPYNYDPKVQSFKLTTASYDNQPKRIIDAYTMQLFSEKPKRFGLDDELEYDIEFKDIYNRTIPVDQFWKQISTYVMVLGEVFIIIDTPEISLINGTVIENEWKPYGTEDISAIEIDNEIAISLEQKKALGIKNTVQIVLPSNVVQLNNDTKGNISEITIKTATGYVYWTKKEKREWNLITERGANNSTTTKWVESPRKINISGVVPVSRCLIDMDRDGYGDSFISDIADLNRDVYNLDAIQKYDLFTNSQNILLLPLTEDLAMNYETWGLVNKKTGQLDLKDKDYLPQAPAEMAKYLVKDLKYHEVLFQKRNSLIEAIDKMSNSTMNRMIAQSGVSKAYDNYSRVQILEALSYIIEGFEVAFWDIYFKFVGTEKDDESVQIVYKHVFDVVNSETRLKQLIETKNIIGNPEVKKAIDKIILQDQLRVFLTDDELKELVDILDKEDYEIKEAEMDLIESTNNSNNITNESNSIEDRELDDSETVDADDMVKQAEKNI